ncbi:GNAT family N-acetyltransferase [Aeromicrobium sp. CF4.19]|uniref:GNAT family N-acetyltransferase n=1 Tax=Aeromicrobium sp. CF4.19 TaxID=3373082 RepID=UPI003EE52C61
MHVEAMRPEHGPAVLEIFGEGIATGHATFETQVPSWGVFDSAKLADHRFVAVEEDRVVGWAAVSPTSSRAVYRGVVEDALYVSDQARGRGVGRALLTELVRSTERAGIWTITSGIFPENATSLALHESLGFRRVGVRERLGLMQVGPLSGTWRDVVWLERRVAGVAPPRR